MRKTLPSFLLAAVVVLVGLPAFAGDGSNLLQFVPSTATVVVGVDVDKVRGTPLWDQGMSLVEDNDDLQSALSTIGFDPRQTASTILFASTEAGSDIGDHAVVLIEIAYPAEELAAALVGEAYEADTVGEIAFYRKSESTIAFVGSNVLAVGEFTLVEAAINAAAGESTAGASGSVASQISSVDKSGAIWAVVQLPAGSQGAETARMSVDLSAGFSTTITVAMESEELATTTATQLSTQVTVLSGQPEIQGLGLGAVLAAVQATSSGSDLNLSVSVDASTWATLVQTLGALAEEELR
jgi:hypothetical protein